ncbi:MAG: 2Fe-2S iron-sulfur cluster-binding protein [Kofleriaceae bacterium]
MARRLPDFDAQRGAPVEIRLADAAVRAYANESIAAAALASGTRVMSRSLKYHRPRSFFCLEGHCSGCLVRLDGVPNLRACQAPCTQGAKAAGQNAFPSAEVDLLGAVDFLFARGLDHHTLMTGSSVLNKLANKVVRQLSGLGKLPAKSTNGLPEVGNRAVDACVIGGGPAGLAAATAVARTGKRVVVVDDQLHAGGSLRADPSTGREVANARVAEALAAGVELLGRSTAIGYFPEDDGGVLAVATPGQLVRVHARAWIWATGGYVVNLPFADNDRPGVIAARAIGRLLVDHGILGGDKVCIVEVPRLADESVALAAALTAAGAEVTRVALDDTLGTRGRSWVSSVQTSHGRIDCDVVAVAAIPSPASEGPRQQGCAVVLDPEAGGFRVVIDDDGLTSTPNVWACGDVTGYLGPSDAAAHGARIGSVVAAALATVAGGG